MAQKRYFNYNELLKSKESSEAIAMASGGIGPVMGFRYAQYTSQTKELNLSPSNDHTQDLLDREGVTHTICGCVITNDGIITTEEGIWVTIKDVTLETNKYYFVLATHRYIEDSTIESPTTYSVVEIPDKSFSDNVEFNNIVEWLYLLKSIGSTLTTTHTIVCLLKVEGFNRSNLKVFTPYHYVWPISDQLPVYEEYSLSEGDDSNVYKSTTKIIKYLNPSLGYYTYDITISITKGSGMGTWVGVTIPSNIMDPITSSDGNRGCIITKLVNAVGSSENVINQKSIKSFCCEFRKPYLSSNISTFISISYEDSPSKNLGSNNEDISSGEFHLQINVKKS